MALSCFSVWRASPHPSLQQAFCGMPPLTSQPFGVTSLWWSIVADPSSIWHLHTWSMQMLRSIHLSELANTFSMSISIFVHVHTWSMLRHVLLIEIANTQLFTHTWSILRRLLFHFTCQHTNVFLSHPDWFFHVHTCWMLRFFRAHWTCQDAKSLLRHVYCCSMTIESFKIRKKQKQKVLKSQMLAMLILYCELHMSGCRNLC